MEIKQVKDLTMGELNTICNDIYECSKCPLLISSRAKKIICLKNEEIPISDVLKTSKLMNKQISINTNIREYKILE